MSTSISSIVCACVYLCGCCTWCSVCVGASVGACIPCVSILFASGLGACGVSVYIHVLDVSIF